jgi:hypothetical protein
MQLGAVDLLVSRLDDSTVLGQLPDGDGQFTLRIGAPGYEPWEATVTLHGFRGSADGPLLSGFLQVVPGHPWVLGAGDPGLVEVDVRANTVLRQWPDTVHSPDCTWGVGSSVRSGHYVLFGKAPGGGCTHPWVWQYGSTLRRVDSLWAYEDAWTVAEIGPGGNIVGADDHLTISRCDAAGCTNQPYTQFNLGGSLTGVTIGRGAERAILHHFYRLVVDAQTGDTLYRLPFPQGWYHVEGAAFSRNEDTTYAVAIGLATGSGSHLVMVRSASGALLDSLSLPGVSAFDVARDPNRPWLFVAALEGPFDGAVPQLHILRQGTLATVAVLRTPATESLSLAQWHQFRLVIDPPMEAAYIVATNQTYDAHGPRAKILRFGLVP